MVRYSSERTLKDKIIGSLKVCLVMAVIGITVGGMIYFINKEETGYPNYIIRTEKDFYRTDTFSVDSNKCINFISIEYRPFRKTPKTRSVQICGGRYIVEEKWKK